MDDEYSLNDKEELETAEQVEVEDDSGIDSFQCLTAKLDELFSKGMDFSLQKPRIESLLRRVNLVTTETNKYTYFDVEKPYTRNLVFSDGKHYTLLVLCWGPGRTSKIHNHPCDGCFIKTISGCIKETRYSTIDSSDEIRQSGIKFYSEGQVSYMSDDLGLHKIGNPNLHVGAVTLHLYTPPFQSCKAWSSDGVGELSRAEISVMGYFSVFGLRTPNLEGKPGLFARMLHELLHVRGREDTATSVLLKMRQAATHAKCENATSNEL